MKWLYVSGGVQRSGDDRFEISEHSKGFSVYDSDYGSAFARDFASGDAAKRAALRVARGGRTRYELDAKES